METTRLSSKGQVIIPKAVRDAHQWGTGLELVVIDTGDGILLRPKQAFAPSGLDEVAGFLKREQPTRTLADMEAAIRQGVQEQVYDRD
ncbi:MAG: AbrB/MazE/SpoVT family DNA-binding domain-containing protein [Acidobacteria bacterium]|nr:AbrB/MazE/SpoVT family DNA-binding domain-containing protein [Acidobacteriota bacterium]MCB9399048.1 AbrB/MazE/SpoVT family DNA-binding domain-containing protein [Acidobacteriota bacterium]